MRYKVKTAYGLREIPLSEALQPVALADSGRLEDFIDLAAQAELNAACIGRLAAALVERQIITFDEALVICDRSGRIEAVED